jgi:hypothetical protein
MFRPLIIAVVFLIGGCEHDKWQGIGTYIPQDLSSTEINSVLEPAGIAWTSEGSRAYALEVAPSDAQQAARILKESSIGNRIRFWK